jgi:hypothetical protein
VYFPGRRATKGGAVLKTIRAEFAAGRAARCTWHYSILAQLIAMSPMAAARVAAEPAPQASTAAGEYGRAVERALTAFREHKFNEARALFEQADRLQRSARTLRGLGASDLALSRYTIAKTELEDALIDSRNPLTPDQRNEVLSWLAWMNSSLAVLRLELSPSHASLVVDTERTTARLLLLDPGEHSVRVHADGFEPFERNITLERDKPQLLHVVLDRVDQAGTRSQTAPVKAPVAATTQALPTTPEHKPALTERWWFWTGLAAIVAAGSVTAIVLSTQPQPAPYASGGLGGKVEALHVQP